MADERNAEIPAKWDAFLDLGFRRFVYSSLAGAVSSLLIFRSPTTCWASIAFGAGVGIGSAYSECSLKYDRSPPKLTSNISGAPLPEAEE